MITSLLGISHVSLSSPLESWYLAWLCFTHSVQPSTSACPTFIASTECKIGLVHYLPVDRRCENIWRLCHGSRDEIPLAFSLCLYILHAIKNWRYRRPGNKASWKGLRTLIRGMVSLGEETGSVTFFHCHCHLLHHLPLPSSPLPTGNNTMCTKRVCNI